MMPFYAYAILGASWALWLMPFVLAGKPKARAAQVDRNARWGMLLQAAGYAVVWQGSFWMRALPEWRLAISAALLALAVMLSWTSTRALGKQWRLDAGINADHELVTSGPYGIVRHPIYTSMFLVLEGTGFMISPAVLQILATVIFILGAEIRVRSEEKLLASQFGEKFEEYRGRVPAYLPLVR
ncbi:MAG TPA: isoprenylcysteine carboxylmethyltransferase family protein [Terriglobales bacterium]|nr:isoprenylcysteine carboxylmethyltransferase family protein [Terriglobales bacterium]